MSNFYKTGKAAMTSNKDDWVTYSFWYKPKESEVLE